MPVLGSSAWLKMGQMEPDRSSMTKNWKALVAQGRELVRNIGKFKWELGDLARKVDDEDLEAFSREVHTSTSVLSRYKKVAAFWPPSYRDPDVAFSVYEELMRWSAYEPSKAQAEYDRLVVEGVRLSVDDIRMAHGKTPTRAPTGAKGRADYAKRLMDDPDVRREVARDASFAAKLAQDREQHARQEAVGAAQGQRNRAKGITDAHARVDAQAQMESIKYRIARVIDTLKDEDLNATDRASLAKTAGDVVDAAELLRDFLGNTDQNFEEQVALLLQDGS